MHRAVLTSYYLQRLQFLIISGHKIYFSKIRSQYFVGPREARCVQDIHLHSADLWCPVWFTLLSETDRRRLRAQQSYALRTLANAYALRDLDEFVERVSTNLFVRADRSHDPHMWELVLYHQPPPDRYGLPRDLVTVATTPGSSLIPIVLSSTPI